MMAMQTLQVQTEAHGAVSGLATAVAVRKVRSLLRIAPGPVLFARVKLTMAADPAVKWPAIAQVSLDLNGRLIRAQATGADYARGGQPDEPTGSGSSWSGPRATGPATRGGEPVPLRTNGGTRACRRRACPSFPRPPEERKVIRHKAYALARQSPEEAITELELLDYDFYLFTERATGQDSVLYRTADGYRLAQARPRPGGLGPVHPAVTVSEHPAPRLTPAAATARLEALGQPFLFFVNSETRRGNLIYHRYHGNYGVITRYVADPVSPSWPA